MSQAATEAMGQEPNANGATGTGQEPTGGTGATGQEPGTQQADGATGTDGHIDVASITDPALRAFVEKQQREAADARAEAAKHRTEAKAAKDKVSEYERANETAEQAAARQAEEAQAERDRLATENRDLKVGLAVRDAATKANALDPDVVLKLIQADVKLDDTGHPTNVPDLLADLRTKAPYLFKRQQNDAGDGNGAEGEPSGDMNDRIRGAWRGKN